MSGIIKIEIVESVEELYKLLKLSESREVKERVLSLYWLKTQQVATTEAIASLVGKHRTTVSRWLSSYRRGGLKSLLAKGKSTGRTRMLTPEIEQKLR